MSGEITIVQGALLDEQQIVGSSIRPPQNKLQADIKNKKGHIEDV